MYAVTLVGGSAPFREAVLSACDLTDGLCADAREADDQRAITVVVCDSEERWSQLEELSQAEDTKTLAILDNLDVQDYARALVVGADGVVHADTGSSIIASVVRSATIGETILPKFVARSLASKAQQRPVPTELTEYDRELLAQVCEGARISELAERFNYSERTIRRQLQHLYLTLDVSSRAQAISFAVKNGLC